MDGFGRHWVELAIVCSLSSLVCAGEIKSHDWPYRFVEEGPLCEIPVSLATVPTYCSVAGGPLKLKPVAGAVFEGRSDVYVRCNVNITLTCSVVPTSVVAGKYSASFSKNDIDAPSGVVELRVRLTDAAPGGRPGQRNVTVANVVFRVAPRP